MKHLNILLTLLLISIINNNIAQFQVDAIFRPKYEFRQGYKNPIGDDDFAAQFITQRTRLNFGFKNEYLSSKISFQNVRTWGDVSTLSMNDVSSNLHEAWAEIPFDTNISLIVGRQELVYDDHRILGNVDWAQQGRSHDAAVLKFGLKNNAKLHFGLAMNLNSEMNSYTIDDSYYNTAAGYKNMQYLWYNRKINNLSMSLLALNVGNYYKNTDTTIIYNPRLTIGTHLEHNKNKLNVNGSLYYQLGKSDKNNISGFEAKINLLYTVNENVKLGFGGEILSGKAYDDTTKTHKAFDPTFGTNHKFNGWMDYYYVGNHADNVGLIDINALFSYHKNKFGFEFIPHYFMAAKEYIKDDKAGKGLGIEIDTKFSYKLNPNVSFAAGLSLYAVNNNFKMMRYHIPFNIAEKSTDKAPMWGWMMVVINPTIFKSK